MTSGQAQLETMRSNGSLGPSSKLRVEIHCAETRTTATFAIFPQTDEARTHVRAARGARRAARGMRACMQAQFIAAVCRAMHLAESSDIMFQVFDRFLPV